MKTVQLLFMLAFCIVVGASFRANQPSEMARLMKKMLQYLQQEKKQIETNQPKLPFQVSMKQLTHSKITKGKKLSLDHLEFAEHFHTQLTAYQTSNEHRAVAFDLIVASCIRCHTHECPGPIQVIEKNKMQ